MDRILYGGGHYVDLDMPGLEAQLAEVLVPVIPRLDFVIDLKKRLLDEHELSLLPKKQNPIQAILLGFAGVISGALILLIGLRAIIALLGGKGYFQQFKEQIQKKKIQTLGSVT
jgi:hypothetical protein